MGKMITAILAIAVLAGASWYALNRTAQPSAPASAAGPSEPKRQLDNVRQAAHRIESDGEQRVQDLDAKMQTGQ